MDWGGSGSVIDEWGQGGVNGLGWDRGCGVTDDLREPAGGRAGVSGLVACGLPAAVASV